MDRKKNKILGNQNTRNTSFQIVRRTFKKLAGAVHCYFKFSTWLSYAQKWFSYSANDLHIFDKWFLYLPIWNLYSVTGDLAIFNSSRFAFLDTKIRCETYSELKMKTPEWTQWHRPDVFIINFEHISHLVLVLHFLTLSMYLFAGLDE